MSELREFKYLLSAHFGIKKEPKSLKEATKLILNSDTGHPVQKVKSRLHRKFAIVSIMVNFGLQKTMQKMAKKLLDDCITYSMYHMGTAVADLLSRYCGMNNEVALAEYYHKAALGYAIIHNAEMRFNWEFTQIRNNFGTPDFLVNAVYYEDLAKEVKKTGLPSVRLTFIYHELCFFHAYVLKDMQAAAEACRKAMDYFDQLPYDHQLAKNIFIIHLADLYIHHEKNLVQAELIIQSALENIVHSRTQKMRFKELLKKIKELKKIQPKNKSQTNN